MGIDLIKIQKGIEKGFQEGSDDEEMAKELGVSPKLITTLRISLGLAYTKAIDVFNESKTLIYVKASERFKIDFHIEPEHNKKLGLDDSKKYSYFASILKPKTIQINIIEKVED